MKSAKEIWSVLRFCPYCRVITKVYRGLEYFKNDAGVVGFLCRTNSNLGKSAKLEKVREYCKAANLPVVVDDIESHLTEFKIRIVK